MAGAGWNRAAVAAISGIRRDRIFSRKGAKKNVGRIRVAMATVSGIREDRIASCQGAKIVGAPLGATKARRPTQIAENNRDSAKGAFHEGGRGFLSAASIVINSMVSHARLTELPIT